MGQIDLDGSNSTLKADVIRGQTGTTVKLGGVLDTDGNYVQSEKGGDLTSASPLVIDTDGSYFDVTGTTNFAAMTVAADRQFTLQFDGVLTMTHHATNLDLPGEANITTAAGDVATFQSTGSNTVQCINYTKADGTGVVSAGGGNKTMFVIAQRGVANTNSHNSAFSFIDQADGGTSHAWGTWYVPSDFTSLASVTMVIIDDGSTGNMYSDFQAAAMADGDTTSTDTDTIAVTTYALTSGQVSFIDVTAMANGLTFGANHAVGLRHNRQGGHANDTLSGAAWCVGYAIEYT